MSKKYKILAEYIAYGGPCAAFNIKTAFVKKNNLNLKEAINELISFNLKEENNLDIGVVLRSKCDILGSYSRFMLIEDIEGTLDSFYKELSYEDKVTLVKVLSKTMEKFSDSFRIELRKIEDILR